MVRQLNTLAIVLASMLLSIPTFAAQDDAPPADAPAAQPAAAQPAGEQVQQLEATIRAVRGPLAEVRLTEDGEWQPATVNMKVPVGAELRTGPRSMIQFTLPPDQLVTVDRVSNMTLLKATQQGNTVTTDIGLKQGRTAVEVSDPNITHEPTVRSPNATNAVRGTESIIHTDDPLYGAFVKTINTPSIVTNSDGKQIPFGGEGETSEMPGWVFSEGEWYFLGSILDPFNNRSRTDNEHLLVGRFQGTGGLDTSRSTGGFRDAATRNTFDDQLTAPFGRLIALLTWNTSADLDLFVIDSDGFQLATFPFEEGFETTSPNGGLAGPDILSGPAGEFIVYTGQTIPTGDFEAGAFYFNGPDTEFTIRVFKDGVQVGDDFTGTVGPLNVQESDTFNVPDDNGGGVGFPDR